jgi:hypothetical protein
MFGKNTGKIQVKTLLYLAELCVINRMTVGMIKMHPYLDAHRFDYFHRLYSADRVLSIPPQVDHWPWRGQFDQKKTAPICWACLRAR